MRRAPSWNISATGGSTSFIGLDEPAGRSVARCAYQRFPLERPAEIAAQFGRQPERKIEAADPGARSDEQGLEGVERFQPFNSVDDEGHPLHPPGGDRDRLSATGRRGEVNAEDLQASARRPAAETLWMRPKPATKRASRGAIFQKEKSASSKLTACCGKRCSQAAFNSGISFFRFKASPRIETRISVNGSGRPSSVSAIDSATRGSCSMSWVCQASRLTCA